MGRGMAPSVFLGRQARPASSRSRGASNRAGLTRAGVGGGESVPGATPETARSPHPATSSSTTLPEFKTVCAMERFNYVTFDEK